MRFSVLPALLALLTAAPPALATNLIGQSATATFTSFAATSSNPFTSLAVVGAGSEFTGDFADVFGQNWFLDLDIGATTFTLKISEATRPGNGNISSSANVLDLGITGLTGLSPVTLASYTCASAGFSCSTFGSGPNVGSLVSTATSLSFGLTGLRDGETYVFSTGAVPEPASWAMMIAGFGLVGVAVRRRRVAVAAFA